MNSSSNNKLKNFLKLYNVVLAIVFVLLVFLAIFYAWLERDEYYTQRFIGQKYLPLVRKNTVPPLIIEGNTQDRVNVLYGTVVEKEYTDTIDTTYIKDVFTDRWYLTFVNQTCRFDTIFIDNLTLNIDGKLFDIDIKNDKGYAMFNQPLYFDEPPFGESNCDEFRTRVLPLPQIPTKTLDLTMSGTITDVDDNVYPFTYSAEGILWEDEHDRGSPLASLFPT